MPTTHGDQTPVPSAPVLVTGSSGYIGSAVVRHLVAQGFAAVGFDRHTPAAGVLAGAPHVDGDVRDRAAVGRTIREHGVRSVVHVAGLKSVAESLRHPDRYFDTNTAGTLSVIRAMIDQGVQDLVFSSSAAIYGIPDELPVTEEAPFRPANPYGESKALVERMLPWFEHNGSIRSVSLRYFNAAGASDDGAFGEDWTDAVNLIPVAMRAAARGEELLAFGTDYPTPDGTAVRDYIHVDDLATAHQAALGYLAAGGASVALNLGTGEGASVKQVIEAIGAASGKSVTARYVGRRAGDPAAVWANADRAREVLGWGARRQLPEIVESAWRWHRRQAADDVQSVAVPFTEAS